MNCILTHKHPKILWNQRYLSEFHKCHLQDAITYSFHGIWVDELWKKGLFTHPIYTLFDLSEYSSTSLLILSQAPSQRMNLNRGGGGGRDIEGRNANKLQSLSKSFGTLLLFASLKCTSSTLLTGSTGKFHFVWHIFFHIWRRESTCRDSLICVSFVPLNLEILIGSDFLKNKI